MKHTIILLFLSFSFVNAQTVNKCATTDYIDYLDTQYPGIKANIQSNFERVKSHAQTRNQLKTTHALEDTVYRIPVVFHVVYKEAIQNVHDSLLLSQLKVLNEDFRRLNADTTNTRSIFKSRAADAGIEFFLATIDPNGNPTSGITRTLTTVETFNTGFLDIGEMDKVKKSISGGIDAWDTDKYLNIWVCNITNQFLGDALLGYAYPPLNTSNWPADATPIDSTVWGVNIHYKIVGQNNPNATGLLAESNKGRATVHEVGHFLGLRHIWGDSGNPLFGGPDCNITEDDGFSDTPHMGSNSQETGCDFTKNTCTNGEVPDEPDMVENYMDYSTEACQNMFTQQQTDFMRSMLVIGRPNLAHIIQNDTFNLSNGTWIVHNGDTTNVSTATSITINTGDSVMFLNENNGVYYIAEETMTLNSSDDVYVTENATILKNNDTNTGIGNFDLKEVVLFPNPTKNIIHLNNLSAYHINSIKVVDLNGKTIKSISVYHDEMNIDVTELNNGIYFLSFESNSHKVGVKKLNIIK